jgi:hypothetical protein
VRVLKVLKGQIVLKRLPCAKNGTPFAQASVLCYDVKPSFPISRPNRENFPTHREFTPMTAHSPISYSEIEDRFQHPKIYQEIKTMKKHAILWLMLCVVLLVAPTMAQDAAEAETPMATFGDETGLFSLQYPADLFVANKHFTEQTGLLLPAVAFTSSLDILSRPPTPPYAPIAMGDWGIAVLFFPKAMFAPMGVAADAPILDVANAWAQMFLTGDGSMTFQPDPVILDSGAEAILMTGRGEDDGAGGPAAEDNYLMLFEITDGVIALTTIVSAVDGRTPEMEALHLAVTNSIEFTGTAENVLALMPTGQ